MSPMAAELDVPAERKPAVASAAATSVPRTPRSLGRHAALFALYVLTAGLIGWSWVFPAAYPTCWLGLALFFVLVVRPGPLRAFAAGACLGGLALGVAFHWAPATIAQTLVQPLWVGWAVFAGLLLWESIPFGIAAAAASSAFRRGAASLWIVPPVWVAAEHFWPKVFPWRMAYSQTSFLDFIQIADLAGAAAVSFCLISAVLLPAAWLHAPPRSLSSGSRRWLKGYTAITLLLLLATFYYGHERQRHWEQVAASQPALPVGLVQADPSFVDSIETLQRLSDALPDNVRLICWPECSLGNYSLNVTDLSVLPPMYQEAFPPVIDLAPLARLRCELLAGGKSFHSGATEVGPFYQTAYLLSPARQILGRYQKRALLPIGEYVPGQSYFPALRELAAIDDELHCGSDPTPIELSGGQKIGVVICYEDMIAKNARESVAAGAAALICLTNASDFQNPLALEQHLRLALFRAVENRRYFARCAATGISCVVTPTGELSHTLADGEQGTLVANLAMIDELTCYTRGGYHFPAVCLGLSVGGLACSWFGRRRQRHATNHVRDLPPSSATRDKLQVPETDRADPYIASRRGTE